MQVARPAEITWRTFAENCWYIHARELTLLEKIAIFVYMNPIFHTLRVLKTLRV